MPVSSLIVRGAEGRGELLADEIGVLAEAIGAVPGLRVARVEGDRVVVIAETETAQAERDLWDRLQQMDGVLGVDLVYHNIEDLVDRNDEQANA